MPMQFNSDLLRVARQARGLSQSDLSGAAGVSQANISKLENGLIGEPTPDVLDKLARALHFPRTLFMEPDRVVGLPMSVHAPMYRKKASVGERSLAMLEAEINLRLLQIRRLLKAADFGADLARPSLDPDDFPGGPEQIAELVRRTWLVPSGPVKNLVEWVERAGCIVVHCDLTTTGIDGVTVQAPGLPPCIFLNRSQTGDRQRFTLAHELGHIIMHRFPSPEMEQEANAFASAFLMPERDVRPYLSGGLTLQKLASLKLHWRVSMASLIFRASRLETISATQSQYLWRQMSARGYRLREPPELDLQIEQPTVLPEIVRLHVEDLGYGVEELSRVLHLHTDELGKFQPMPRRGGAHLTVVK